MGEAEEQNDSDDDELNRSLESVNSNELEGKFDMSGSDDEEEVQQFRSKLEVSKAA